MNEQETNLFKERSPATVALDNLVRRKLKVSDPTNASEIAEALSKLYVVEKEAMDREAIGVPYRAVPALKAVPQVLTSSHAELEQAKKDVEHDLKALAANSLLKDIQPELNGWASAIRTAISDGVNAARFALDPKQRDKTFSIRRLLGDYSRVARFIGALTPTMSLPYRQLAKSLDEVAGVLLVLMGESFANISFGGGRFLLQAPVSGLQERRDAVIYALRNLIGSTQEAYGPNDWPRGLQAYMQFIERLEENAQHDLRALFNENELARIMDELIHHATGNTSEGYRALGSTAQLALGRFRRLILFGQKLVRPESPPLAAFLSALKLFLNAFENADSGYRLLTLSRPPVLFYGLYGIGGQDPPSRRLLNLVIQRGKLADKLDCYLGCKCDTESVQCQIVLDKVLYDVDRAIDLYALGREDFGEPEQRAAAYGYVIEVVREWSPDTTTSTPCCPELDESLQEIRDILWFYTFKASFNPFIAGDFEGVSEIILRSDTVFKYSDTATSYTQKINFKANLRDELKLDEIYAQLTDIPESLSRLENMLSIIHQELCIQKDMEKQWRSLLQTMAPKCIKFNGAMDIINKAIENLGEGMSCPYFGINIPPHFETSLAGTSYDRPEKGEAVRPSFYPYDLPAYGVTVNPPAPDVVNITQPAPMTHPTPAAQPATEAQPASPITEAPRAEPKAPTDMTKESKPPKEKEKGKGKETDKSEPPKEGKPKP